MRILLLPVLLLGCGTRDAGVDGPLGAFSMRYEPLIDASEGTVVSIGDEMAWAVVDGELTVYDGDWQQVMRVGGVSSAGAVLDVGVWLSNGLVFRSEAGANGTLQTMPAELGTPLEIRRGDGGELWIMGESTSGGTLASSTDAGVTWVMRAAELTAGGATPETLELRNVLGGFAVVLATSTAAGTSTTWKITGSGAEEWQDGAFLTYPVARLPDGFATQLADERDQFDALPLGWTESWSSDEADGWTWTHGVGVDLSQERVPVEIVAADDAGHIYVHDQATLFRSVAPFAPEGDQADDIAAGSGCDHRHRIDWSLPLGSEARDTTLRNGLAEEVLLYELFEDGTASIHDGPLSPDGGTEIVLRMESWLYATDADGRCLGLVQGSDLKAREHWLE